MSPERQLQVFEELGEKQAIKLLNLMAPDLVTDLLGRLNPTIAKKFIEAMVERQRNMVIELLRYPEDSVGGIMTNDVGFIAADLTVSNAREKLRPHLKGPDFVNLIYVVDDDRTRKLRGVLSLRQLFVAPAEKKIEEIMDAYVSTLRPLESASAAAYKLLRSHVTGMPVVNLDGKLVGVVTVDAAVAIVAPTGWTDVAPKVFS
jgi:Mg/Co/Ni transporter MgtE